MDKRYDAIIVGAGPAGAYLGYLLARDGFRVVIIDKARFPRDKVCGGGLSNKTLDAIDFDLSPVIHRTITGAFLTYKNQDTVITDLGRAAGAMIVRSEFDSYLLEQATAQGARFYPSTEFHDVESGDDGVTVKTNRGNFYASYLFGADGVSSQVRKVVFGNGLVSYAPALEALVKVPDAVLDKFSGRALFDLAGMPHGYGWIFPKRDHLNVGVYSAFGSTAIRKELSDFMGRYECLRGYDDVIQCQGYAIPFRNNKKTFEKGRVWLLGDAAGLAEALFGEGIYFAVRSATLAWEVLKAENFQPRPGAYTRHLRRRLLPQLAYAALLGRSVFTRPSFAFHKMARNTFINNCFSGLITGEQDYRACFFKTVMTLPCWLLAKRQPCLETML